MIARVSAALLLVAAPLLAAPLLTGCGAEQVRTYEVRGVVVGTQFGGEALVVDHEPIPGFMDAMRMSFRLDDPSQAASLAPGDSIHFELVVEDEAMHVARIEPLR